MLRLKPHSHSLPDNVWHTALIAMVSTFFVWQSGQQIISMFLSEVPVTPLEQRLADGDAHPLHRALFSLSLEDFPFLWNRIFSTLGWIFSLGLVIRLLKPSSGFVGALPAWILLFTLPGFSLWMCAAGSPSWGVYFFLKAFLLLTTSETRVPLIRGGAFAAGAVLIHPVWFLPALGLLAGSWELFRVRVKWIAGGFGAALLTGGLLFLIFRSGGEGLLIPGPAFSDPVDLLRASFVMRYLILLVTLLLLLAYGSMRRGLGWWSLALSLPLLVLQPLLQSGWDAVLVPFWVFASVGLVRLPPLLNVPFPRVYQTVLLCQLCCWLPVYLDQQPLILYPWIP